MNNVVGATTGFTRGRNGISRQWGAMRFDRKGNDHPFEIDESQPFEVFEPSPEMPVKLIGTNMAFRKSALLGIDGFDENYHFFLDETDAKLRMDRAGWKTAIVAQAQIHHGFAASARRLKNRVPTDLFEIGASKAYFCKSHLNGETETALREFTIEQLIRLTTLVEQHKIRRREVTPLMNSLANGISEGLQRERHFQELTTTPDNFRRFEVFESDHVVLCAGPRDTGWIEKAVPELVEAGKCVSVIQLLRSARYFQVNFNDGYWLHRGGVWGKSIRDKPLIQIYSYKRRFKAEINRISALHPADKLMSNPTRK